MKKILLVALILVLCACSLNLGNTPKEKVKEFLDGYKNQDSKLLEDLDNIIDKTYTGEYKERYKNLMIKQYKNLSYEITDEIIEDDKAVVTANVTVYNYSASINYANEYIPKHKEEFSKKTNNENEQTITDNDKILEFKLSELEKVDDKKTYTINFSLHKENNEWVLENLSNKDIEKIHGIYTE